MTNRLTLILLLLANLAGTSAVAETSLRHTPNWSEADALAAIGSVDTAAETAKLNQLAGSGDSAALLEKAAAIHENDQWPAPAREFVLFNLARSLADFPPGQIDTEVPAYLASLPVDVRIVHPDHPGFAVPMFNVAAAATGAAVEWERQAASLEASELIRHGQQGWLDAYIQATPVQRNGFRRSVATYADPELTGLAELALDQAEAHPGLAVIATMAGLRLGNSWLFTRSLTWNEDAGLAEMLRLSREVFQPKDLQKVLVNAVQLAPTSTASLVIAELAPTLLDQPRVEDLMFELLGDRDLGASAALALSQSQATRVRSRLATVAGEDSGIAARRAGLALSSTGGAR